MSTGAPTSRKRNRGKTSKFSEPKEPEVPLADVEAERRQGYVAGAAGIGALLLTLAVLPVGASKSVQAGRPAGDLSDKTILSDIHRGETEQLIGLGLRAASLLLTCVLAVYLFRVVRARNPKSLGWIPVLGIAAFLVAAVTTMLGFIEVRDAARDFYASGARTDARATELLDRARDSSLLRISSVLQIAAGFATGLWVSLVSYESMQVGLLTRSLALFGIGAGVTYAVGLPIGQAMFLGWSASIAILVLGWWPGGRPPAWAEGRSVPWSEVDERDGRRRAARGLKDR